MDDTLNWLQKISETPGVSGFEDEVRKLLVRELEGIADVEYDKIGSVIFAKHGIQSDLKVMIASHMDEIGFIVKNITKEGFLRFATLGGWWEQVMLGQRVIVHTCKGELQGVIGSKPPHLLTPEERKKVMQKNEMYIDVGASDEKEAKEIFGVRSGDPIVPFSSFVRMANPKLLLSKAWDDRVGCAIMVDVLKRLNSESHPNSVYGVGTVQEEVGLRGAKTSTAVIDPDVAFAVDTCISGDTPGVSEDQATSKLGKGVAISIFDSSLIPHTKLRNYVIDIAEREHIPYQLDFTERGGTDGGRIHLHGQGVPSLVLSIPTRYIHSHNGIIHRDDYQAGVDLLVAVLKNLDRHVYDKLQCPLHE